MVDGLKLVSTTDLRRELGSLIAGILQSQPLPIAAFPAREAEPGRAAHEAGREGDYHLFDPSLPGSEAVVGNILTGVLRQPASSGRMLSSLDLRTMRHRKVRTILLVDDFSGSGKRLLDFDRALRRHPTIRSWASGRFIDVHVALYAATNRAAALLRRRFGDERVHIVHACPTFAGAGWSPEQLEEVEALCWAHRRRRGKHSMAFGFQDSRALIAFEHSAPNNLPFVLWKEELGWNSLFAGKAVPPDLLGLFTMDPAPGREPLAGTAGAQRLGQIVDLLGRRVRDAGHIAEITDISIPEVRRLLDLTQKLGLTGATLRLTDRGRLELRRWRSSHAPLVLPNRDDPYYPHQLRAER